MPALSMEDAERWKAEIASKEFPKRWESAYTRYIDRLNGNKFPVIFEGEHLARLMGIEPNILSRAVYDTISFYRFFEVSKRSGGSRLIAAPVPSLLYMQRWLASEIFARATIHTSAHAYVTDRSHISHASIHIGATDCLKLDLSDFFGSNKKERVLALLNAFGYLPTVSFQIASLCCLNGSLPQGAGTSPSISNVVLYSLDSRLAAIAEIFSLNYSRYSDDICFSGNDISFSLSILIRDAIEQEGFEINESKSVLMSRGGRRIITGISISSGVAKPPKQFRRALRQEVYRFLKLGLFRASYIEGRFDPLYGEKILGKLNYWSQVEPENRFVTSSKKAVCMEIASPRIIDGS